MKTKSPTITLPSDKKGFASLTSDDFYIEHQRIENPTSMTRYHYHNHYEIYYLLNGERFYLINDKVYHIERGTLVLINSYLIHATTNYAKSSYERLLIEFKKDFLKKLSEELKSVNLFECFEKEIHVIPLGIKEQQFVETLIFSMLDEYKSNSPSLDDYAKSALTQLLLFAGKHAQKTDKYNPVYINSTHKVISEAVGYINNNYGDEISLSKISALFHISPGHFSKTFKRETGLAFCDYLNNVRIKEACKLIHKTDMSISEIAFSVGYNSSTHFGRIFKEIIGTSPLAYKKELRK